MKFMFQLPSGVLIFCEWARESDTAASSSGAVVDWRSDLDEWSTL